MSDDTEEHSRFSPSQAERFLNCPGSMELNDRLIAQGVVPTTSSYALEGTRAHDVVEQALKNGCYDAKIAHWEYSNWCFMDLDDGTNMFYFSVQVMLDHVYELMQEDPAAVLYSERRVSVPITAAQQGMADGTVDTIVMQPTIKHVHITDYKHGAGVAKDADENEQLLQYGTGVVLGGEFYIPEDWKITLTIVQPRAFHEEGWTRSVTVTRQQLIDYQKRLDKGITATTQDDAPLVVDENKQCRFCDAKVICPAREAKALAVVGQGFKQINITAPPKLPDYAQMDVQRLGYIVQFSETLTSWLKAVKDHARELALAGYDIPGTKLVEPQARREWHGDEQQLCNEVMALSGRPREDIMREKIIPLTVAEKYVVERFKKSAGKGAKKQAAENGKRAMAALTLKDSKGQLQLVPETDSRPAVNRANKAFANVQVIPQN